VPKEMKLKPNEEFQSLQDYRNYKSSNGLYDIARENEKFVVGIHWDGVESKNLKQTTYNMIGQTQEVKNASILANELSMRRRANKVDDKHEKTQEAIEAFNLADKQNWDRLDVNTMNEMVVYDGSIQGLGVSYWWWDDTIQTGNKYSTDGDINGKTINSIDLYVANPIETDIQMQTKVKLTVDMTVSDARAYAKSKDVPEDQVRQIVADDEGRSYRAFEKSENDESTGKGDKLTTLLINFEKKEGVWYKSESFRDVVVEEWFDTELELLPIAIFPYKLRKNFIYAEAEMTRYIENQKVANTQAAARHLHAVLMAVPKVLVNENMINSFTNAIGGVNKVKVAPQTQISNAMTFVQPTAMTLDVDKSIDDAIRRTQDLAGVNENIKGEARPENAAALMTQIKQATIPIESYKRRLQRYVKDVGLIWEEFYKKKYNITRVVADEEGNEVKFTGTDFADINLNTTVDVGPSQQWSEIVSFQALKDLWTMQIITEPNQVLERLPENLIKDQDGLVQENQNEAMLNQLMSIAISSQPPEVQQQFAEMPTEEKKEFINNLLGGQ